MSDMIITRWIPVTERLPRANGTVCLVTAVNIAGRKCFRTMVMFFVRDGWHYLYGDQTLISHYHCVVAWMPLPEPYKPD